MTVILIILNLIQDLIKYLTEITDQVRNDAFE